MDETSKLAAGVSVLADGLAVSHYVEALEAGHVTADRPRRLGLAKLHALVGTDPKEPSKDWTGR